MALLLAFTGRAWAGDPGHHQPFCSQEQNLGLKGTGRGGFCRSAAPTPQHALLPLLDLPGDFNFIYKQDENPSSINLGEPKKGLKKKPTEGTGVGEHPEEEEEEVGRANIPLGAECTSASLAREPLPAPQLATRQQRGHCSIFRMSPGALTGHRHGELHEFTPIDLPHSPSPV